MKKPIASALALSLAVATAGATAALALASDGTKPSTRHSYVVGGELVQPPSAETRRSGPTTASTSSRTGSTRHGYVVGGELIVPGR